MCVDLLDTECAGGWVNVLESLEWEVIVWLSRFTACEWSK